MLTDERLTEEKIIADYNKGMTHRAMADKFGIPLPVMTARIVKLQKHQIIERRRRGGARSKGSHVDVPQKPEIEKEAKSEKEENELMNLLSDMENLDSNNSGAGISIRHKEMLIEVLHRILI